MNRTGFEAREPAMDRLPSLSVVVAEVLRLLQAREVDLNAVVLCLKSDPALAGRLLQIANSPFYGLARRVGSVRDAFLALGLHTTRNLVIAAGIIGQFAGTGNGRFDRLAFWQHCAGVGAASRVLAARAGADAELAFTAGLLHDLGRIVLDVHFPGRFQSVLDHLQRQGGLIREAEEAVLGTDHSFLGASLARRWLLPEPIAQGIQFHHSPELEPELVLPAIVHVADVLIRAIEFGDAGDAGLPRLSQAALDRLGLAVEDLGAVLEELEPLLEPARRLVEAASG